MATKKTAAPPAKKAATRIRNSGDGEFISKEKAAKLDPKQTEVEKIKAKPSKAAKKPLKIPKKMGDVADLLYTTRAERLLLNKDVDAMKADETTLKNYVIDNLPKSNATGVSGKTANVRVENDTVFQVDDWDKFYAHIKKTGHFELLNRAINQTAIGERYEGKKPKGIPGIKIQTITKVSVTKVSGK